ncbi:MAG: hypothetical protein J6Q78_04120 [Clostridia bacterium]|nr:hypothetical protein [Clostridia bacterium]
MKKRIFSSLLTLSLAVLLILTALVGCDKNENGTNGDTDKAFGVTVNGKSFSLGDSVSVLVDIAGEPQSIAEAGSCGDQGTLKKYTYSSMSVLVLENDKGSTIDYISLSNDLVTTDKGIRIGASKADVTEAYGDPNTDNGTNIQYISGEFALKFGIENDKVTSITLIRTTE